MAAACQNSVVVEFGVDEGDVEAFEVEELGQFQHSIYVALGRVWHAHSMRLLSKFAAHLSLLSLLRVFLLLKSPVSICALLSSLPSFFLL